jgi:outer membrane protein assembly factor BamE
MSHAPPTAPASVRPAGARRLALLSLLAALPLAGGCVYRMAVQQGNYLDARQVTQVQVGMTRAQVRFLLGTPMLPQAFDNDRWDYLYTLQMRSLKRPQRQRLTVYFEGDKVARIENDGAPTELPAAAPAATSPDPAAPAAAPASPPAPAPDAPPSGLR